MDAATIALMQSSLANVTLLSLLGTLWNAFEGDLPLAEQDAIGR
jgi:hypothetical protein